MKRILVIIFFLSSFIAKSQIDPNEDLYPPLCYGDANGSIAINITGGTGPLNYYWLNGTGTADSLYGLVAGVYTLIVTDVLGTDTFYFPLESPQLLQVDVTTTDSILLCYGDTTVLNTSISGGTSPYSILWNDGDTNLNRVVVAGLYTVEVTDANACFSSDIIVITEPDSLEISIVYTNISCNEGASATITASGGTEPYSYLLNTGDTASTIDSLSGLTYWVVVTDANGCKVTSDTIYLNYYELNTEVYYNDSTHTANIEIESSTSSGPFSYEWLNIFNTSIGNGQISPVLCEGTYFVITTDLSNNCSFTDTVLIENLIIIILDPSSAIL